MLFRQGLGLVTLMDLEPMGAEMLYSLRYKGFRDPTAYCIASTDGAATASCSISTLLNTVRLLSVYHPPYKHNTLSFSLVC